MAVRHILAGAAAMALAAMSGAGMAADPPAPGVTRHVTVRDLPPPDATPSVSNGPTAVARPDGTVPQAPAGFTVSRVAGLDNPRNLLVLPDGAIVVAQEKPGTLAVLRPRGEDGAEVLPWAGGFSHPFGLAFHDGAVWVADHEAVWALPWQGAGQPPGERRRVTGPGAMGSRGGHQTRSLAIAPDGKRFFVGIGSAGNIGEEPEPRATIQEFDISGRHLRTYASGTRNPIGMDFRDGRLYAVVVERDGLGNRLVPDYLTRIEPGGFYGWPYSYIGGHPQPGFADRRPDLVKKAIVPDLLFEAHSSPIGMVFADRTTFPAPYRDGAFVALRGSWNRADPVGYAVAFVPFKGDRPEGGYQFFLTGFRLPDGQGKSARVWGRPTGVAVDRDGSLLVTDDTGDTVWRVSYTGKR